jgi:hypothetical protein
MSLTKIKRPEAFSVLKAVVNGGSGELSRLEMTQLLRYIVALEDANDELQKGKAQ